MRASSLLVGATASLAAVAIFRRKPASASGHDDAKGLAFDEAPTIEEQDCSGCGRHYPLVKAFLNKDGRAHAVAFCALHTHEAVREAWIDVILGTFGDSSTDDHVTFGCRVGPVAAQAEPAATAVDAAQPYGDKPIWGRKLSREEALGNARLPAFWEVVDFLLLADPVVHHHVYGNEPDRM
jgi:hypothetical protein